MRFPLSLCFAAWLAGYSPATAQAPPTQYTVLYTGRLLGYARIPDVQVFNGPQPAGRSMVAKEYMDLFDAKRKSIEGRPVVLLGMGDNFAPDLHSRTAAFVRPASTGSESACLPERGDRIPKDRMFFNGTHWVCWQTQEAPDAPVTIDFDNVAKFFIESHYHALIPGKHDFYFGVRRLQQLAAVLGKNGVSMLGANLVVTTTRASTFANAYPRIPEAYAHHRFQTDFGPTTVDLPDSVLPWKKQFVVKGARQVSSGQMLIDVQGSYICRESGTETASDPWGIPVPSVRPECSKLIAQPPDASADIKFAFGDKDHHLTPGLNHMFCTHLQGPQPPNRSTSEWTCQPFAVQQPLLGAAPPYRLVCEKDGKCIAIFGVVDPDLVSYVGMLNISWKNKKAVYDTVAAVADVNFTLKQVLELCDVDKECRDASKILMAQMSPARASALIGSFNRQFDVVISQADPALRTGNITLTEDVSLPDVKSTAAESLVPSLTTQKSLPRFVLTPPYPTRTITDPKDATKSTFDFVPQVSQADITRPPATMPAGRAVAAWRLANSIAPGDPVPTDSAQCPAGASCQTLESLSTTALSALHIKSPAEQRPLPPTTPPGHSTPVQELALEAMRAFVRTDIAFLQVRDFFNADNLSNVALPERELQGQIDRIIWKSDFVTTLHVTGATLRKLYKQSQKFQQMDQDALSTEVEKGRGLVMLGLFKDPRDPEAFYVNGVRMMDTSLYSVAATDYLAAGDTGYSDLATPDVPPAMRIRDFKELRTINGLVCEQIATHTLFSKAPCDTEILTSEYFDPSKRKPFDDTPGFDTAEHYTTILPRTMHRPDMPASGIEHSTQQRRFWALTLENMDFAFSGTFLNHSSTVPTTFAGVTAAGVTQAGATSYGSDHKLRLVYDFGPGTAYLLSDSAFLRSTITGSTPPSIAANTLGYEAGGTIRLPVTTRPFWLSAHYAVRYEGQMIEPAPTQITYAPTTPAVAPLPTFNLETPKSGTLYGRIGLRIDHADTYFETGVEEADFRGVIARYSFPAQSLYCEPSAMNQFSCGSDPALNSSQNTTPISMEPSLFASGIKPPAIAQSSFRDAGFYLNFNLKFPIWSRRDKTGADQSYYFIVTNKGDWFFNAPSDTTVQTRYLDKLSPAFSIPIYGKLMLTPRVDIILFENKVNENHFRAVEPSVSLSYSFTWRPGMKFGKAAGYGAIATTPPISIPAP